MDGPVDRVVRVVGPVKVDDLVCGGGDVGEWVGEFGGDGAGADA